MKKVEAAIGYNTATMHGLGFVGLRDDLVARRSHGLPLPRALEPLYDDIDKQVLL